MRHMFSIVLFVSLAVACSEKDPCDPGYIFVGTVCILAPADAATKGDAPSDAETGSDLPQAKGFGDTCVSDDDCVGVVNTCVRSPVAPKYCSSRGCDLDPSICPPWWSCFDATPFGGSHICAQPLL